MKTEVHIFSIGNIYPTHFKLPKNIQEHCDASYHLEEKKKVSVANYTNLCKILAKKGHNIDNIYFDSYGKPKMSGVFFSVSHSNKYYGFVISGDEVGFDLEEIVPDSRVDGLAKTVLTPKEKTKLEKAKNKSLYVTERWCVKEGFGKLIGRGLIKESIEKDDAVFKTKQIGDTLAVVVFNIKSEGVSYFLDGEPLSGKR